MFWLVSLECDVFYCCWIREGQRSKRRIWSSKICLRDISLLVCSWMARLFAACKWVTLMKLRLFWWKHSTRHVCFAYLIRFNFIWLNFWYCILLSHLDECLWLSKTFDVSYCLSNFQFDIISNEYWNSVGSLV